MPEQIVTEQIVKHTPGPWTDANARLIAAAPRMYDRIAKLAESR